ncbi:MAG: hypothetical protein JRG96_20910 [Deltaproteobacteria bacterium]|nr:hypothetical protein [Deltaproteobacteria bacterium]MBW2422069.1 hypothetical protein [Deltaproteobacteria bacterium]
MVEHLPDAAPTRRGIAEWGLWLGLLLVLSPVLQHLVEHWIASPWSLYSTAFIALLVLAARADAPVPPRPKEGAGLLAVACLGQLFALKTNAVAVGRPFAAIAVLGMFLLRGTASLRTGLLVLWIVPFPTAVSIMLGGREIVQALYEMGALLLEPLGMAFEFSTRHLSAGDNTLPLDPRRSGLVLATHMSGLAWYSGVRRKLDWQPTLRLIGGYVLLAAPIQFGVIVVSLVLLHFGSPGWTIEAVGTAGWLVPFAIVLAREWKRQEPE